MHAFVASIHSRRAALRISNLGHRKTTAAQPESCTGGWMTAVSCRFLFNVLRGRWSWPFVTVRPAWRNDNGKIAGRWRGGLLEKERRSAIMTTRIWSCVIRRSQFQFRQRQRHGRIDISEQNHDHGAKLRWPTHAGHIHQRTNWLIWHLNAPACLVTLPAMYPLATKCFYQLNISNSFHCFYWLTLLDSRYSQQYSVSSYLSIYLGMYVCTQIFEAPHAWHSVFKNNVRPDCGST